MNLHEALTEISELRKTIYDRKVLYLLEKWNALIIELKALELTDYELQLVKNELSIHISSIINDPIRFTLKSELETFLRFLENVLQIKSGNKIVMFGILFGVLLGSTTGIGIWFGILIGFGAGNIGMLFVRSKYRTLRTNTEDLW
jgi:hypothetical protein